MATENILQRDGTCVASANYGNSQSLAGPSGSGQFLGVVLSTSADRTVTVASSTGAQIYGVLQNKPGAGQAADVAIYGVTKAMSSGTITRGNAVMVNSDGTFKAWASGSGNAQIGWALESAVSGQIFSLALGVGGDKVLT